MSHECFEICCSVTLINEILLKMSSLFKGFCTGVRGWKQVESDIITRKPAPWRQWQIIHDFFTELITFAFLFKKSHMRRVKIWAPCPPVPPPWSQSRLPALPSSIFKCASSLERRYPSFPLCRSWDHELIKEMTWWGWWGPVIKSRAPLGGVAFK